MFNQKTKSLINHLLISALIFAIPSNLFLVLTEKTAYVHGLRIDYLLPKFYLSDIIVLLLTAWVFFSKQIKFPKFEIKNNLFLITATGAFLLFQLITKRPIVVGWQIIKIIEIVWLIFLLKSHWPKLKPSLILISTNLVLIFQSTIGLLQFFNQKSVAGYWLLGEPNLARPIDLAKQIIFGQNLILPYGTTAHPNVLAGFIVAILILNILLFKKIKPNKLAIFSLGFSSFLGIAALLLTGSWSAGLSLIIALILIKLKPTSKNLIVMMIAIWIVSTIIISKANIFRNTTNPSIVRRQYLNQSAIMMLIDHPLVGVGLNNFTTQVEKYSPTREVVRFTQPAHNTFLLILSEIGILGVTFAIFWLKKLNKPWIWSLTMTCATILPILTLDHYLYTLQTGNLIFATLLLSFKNFLDPRQK